MPTQQQVQEQLKADFYKKMSAKQKQQMAMQRRNYSVVAGNGQRMIVKSLLVEIPIPSSPTPNNLYNFPDFQLLRDTSLWGLKLYTSDGSGIATAPSGTALITDAIAVQTFMTLQDYDGYNFVQNMPITDLLTTDAVGVTGASKFETMGFLGQRVNYPNCTLFVNPSTVIRAGTAFSVMMEIFYSFFPNIKMDRLGGTFGSRR